MRSFEEDYVTVDEAATILRVAPSTIRRWIREGDLPAYRVGRRRVALRRADLSTLITPAGSGAIRVEKLGGDEIITIPRMTLEEQQRGLAALERAEQLSKQILARRGGKPFPPAGRP